MKKGKKLAEEARLREDALRKKNWKRWGPYLSERQWGTIREDYSTDGNPWEYFPHDHASRRAYRWGEDGLLGVADREGRLCFGLALWNGKDPILKERLFGLTGPEGNRYFDVFAEYAKASPDDLLIRITVANRGPEPAPLSLLPTLWFRNTWSWGRTGEGYWPRPSIVRESPELLRTVHATLGRYDLVVGPGPDGALPELLFTENETNMDRLFGAANPSPHVKDAFHEYVVQGRKEAVNPEGTGTKAAALYTLEVPAGGEVTVRLRLSSGGKITGEPLGDGFGKVFEVRLREADDFFAPRAPAGYSVEERWVARQAFHPGARTHSSSGFLGAGVWIPGVDRPNSRHRTVPIPLWRFDMQAKRKVISSLLVVVFSLFAGLAVAAGERKVALKADKAGKGASGTAVIVDKGGDQKEVAITAKGLKPNSVYTVWLVNTKPKMDMAGLGEGDYAFKSDDKGNASYSATIGSADLSKWQLIDLACHPSGDPKIEKELMNTALIGKLKK